MKAKYSKSTGGIYPTSAFKTFPDDALDIPDTLYARYTSAEISRLDVVDGNVVEYVPPPPPPETPEQIIARLEGAIDRYLDAQAKSFRYESIRTMVTYENDPNPKFNAEGVGAKQFRSAVYTLGVSLIGEVQSGMREVPTEAELLALMPKLEDFVTY